MQHKYCSNCGFELSREALFCSNCGVLLNTKTYRHREIKGIFDYYKDAINQYAKFSGRTSIKEYWYFTLANMIIGFIAGFVVIILNFLVFALTHRLTIVWFFYLIIISVYFLYIITPSAAITVRRLHDQGKPGFWYFIILIPYFGAFAMLFLMCLHGDPENNQYGEPSE